MLTVRWLLHPNQPVVSRIGAGVAEHFCLFPVGAVAAYLVHTFNAEISLQSRTLNDGGTNFVWSNIQGPVVHHNSRFDPQNPPMTPDQCVFIRGIRAKRVLFRIRSMRAAAKPRPDDQDNSRDDEIQMTRVPGVSKYRDPPIDVLDYIAEECRQDTIAEETARCVLVGKNPIYVPKVE